MPKKDKPVPLVGSLMMATSLQVVLTRQQNRILRRSLKAMAQGKLGSVAIMELLGLAGGVSEGTEVVFYDHDTLPKG